MKIRHVLTSAAMVTAAIFATAAPAAAAPAPFSLPEQKCSDDSTGTNWCLYIEKKSSKRFLVHVGIDVHMSRADAQAIIDAPGNPIKVKMYGSDTFNNDTLFSVPLTDIAASDRYGLSANFDIVATSAMLNEDDSFGDREDEVFGGIVFTDPRTGNKRTFNTPEIHENF